MSEGMVLVTEAILECNKDGEQATKPTWGKAMPPLKLHPWQSRGRNYTTSRLWTLALRSGLFSHVHGTLAGELVGRTDWTLLNASQSVQHSQVGWLPLLEVTGEQSIVLC